MSRHARGIQRSRTWVVREGLNGDCEVERNGRTLQSGLTENAARRWIRQRMKDGDKVYFEGHDGDRIPLREAV